MRLFKFAILILLAVAFTSCKNVNNDLHIANSESDYNESINYFSEGSIDTESTHGEQLLTDGIKTLEGLDGGVVNTDIGQADAAGRSIRFENFTYYRNATGLSFKDKSYLEMDNTWYKLNVGDTFGTLKVSSAYSGYITNGKEYENAKNLSTTDANWYERGVKFDGTVTLEGIITANLNEGAYWENALFFQADPESLKERDFPLLKSIAFSWTRSVYPYGIDNDNVEDTEVFYLGSIEQYDNIFLFQNYADSEGFLNMRVKVELSDINLQYHIGSGSTPCGENRARLCSILSDDTFDIPAASIDLNYDNIPEDFFIGKDE